jgi:hypothetical protein
MKPVSKGFLRLAPFAWLLSSFADAQAECVPRVEPIDGTSIEKSELSSIVVDPPAGTAIDEHTILGVDLEYRVADFSRQLFRLSPQFRTHANGSSRSFDIDGKETEVRLESPAGRVRLCIPLRHIFTEDAHSVLWPLEMKLSLLKTIDASGSQEGVARADWIRLSVTEIPAAARERQARAPTKEYEDSLESAFSYFVGRAALYKTCLQRFQALQPRLTSMYRDWESRHKADIDYVTSLKFEAIEQQFDGRTEIAVMTFDKIDELYLQTYAQLKAENLKAACGNFPEQLSPKGDDAQSMVVGHLAVLRAWQEKANAREGR